MGPHAIIHLFSVLGAGIGGLAPAAVELALTLSAAMAGRRLARTLLRAVPGLGPLAGMAREEAAS